MAKRTTYRKPRNAAERVAEAKAAISRLEPELRNYGGNAYVVHNNVRDAIARWQEVIDRETKSA